MTNLNPFAITTGIISSIGGFIIILTAVITLYLRFRKKFKFVNCKIKIKDSQIIYIEIGIRNRSLSPIKILQIGYKTKNGIKRQFPSWRLQSLQDGKTIPKNKHIMVSKPSTEILKQRLTADLKSKISYLFIKHTAGKQYKYRMIRFIIHELKASTVDV